MKKLGLIGGTGPESTLIYYKEIEYGVQKKTNRNYFPHLTIESLSVFEVLDCCGRGAYEELADYLVQGMENLRRAGCDAGALTAITPHIVFDRLRKRSPIPVISIVETACEYSKNKGYEKVALLGTYPTMTGTFFQEPFESAGIRVVTPDADEMKYIGEKIESEIELGQIIPETQKRFEEIVERLKKDECVDAFVLGCTELPLVFDGADMGIPAIDVMDVHIKKLVDMICEG
ncbi:MAG: amino acid racemase [Anaerovoracaceae bacterium]|nr:amino acid racemase [Anaerovoracaceae bacterium]